jgi:hypothetical protein
MEITNITNRICHPLTDICGGPLKHYIYLQELNFHLKIGFLERLDEISSLVED